MLDHYDFSNAVKNPFAETLNKNRTIILDNDDVVEYFEKLSEEQDIPYQTLIKLYLVDCMKNNRKLTMTWNN